MRKFLIVKPSSFGDVIHTLPVVTAIAEQINDCVIDWVVRPEFADVVSAHPAIRRLIMFDREKWGRGSRVLQTAPELLRFTASLRQAKYDAVLDLQGLFRSALISSLSGAGVRVGFENAREWAPIFYTRKVAVPDVQIHAIDRYQLFLSALGLEERPLDYGLRIPDDAVKRLETFLADSGVRPEKPLAVVNPNARWETKRWLPERFAALGDRLLTEAGVQVVFIGAPSEAAYVEELVSLSREKLGNLAGATSLMELAALLQRADLMITCDSGPMHLAAAVGTPVVALFGPTDPVRTGPYGSGHHVITKGVDCAPCMKRSCSKERRECMAAISVDEVLSHARRCLKSSDNRVTKPSP
ncbi:MAG: lipopolysaccharide heptosyltransferase I [bacterium]|nr:lipopolysaccharide heptosyltransferase I [bacterium]